MQFDKSFLSKDILIISDKDNSYADFEKEYEKKYLAKLFKEIKAHNVNVMIEEVLDANELRQILSKYDKDKVIIFNWCERFNNTDGTETHVTKVYEELGFTYTGGSTKTLELVSNKYKCIEILQNAGIQVPTTYFVSRTQPDKVLKNKIEAIDLDFSEKYIIKSNSFHASTGISMLNLVSTKEDFVTVAKGLIKLTNSDVIVQKFIEGDEYTAFVWGNANPQVLPILKLDFENSDLPNVFTYNAKFNMNDDEYRGTTYSLVDEKEKIYSKIKETVLNAYKTLKMEDYARLEIRINGNEVYVIDYNSNPYINSLYEEDPCEVFICSQTLGYNWGETILKICEHAYMRASLSKL